MLRRLLPLLAVACWAGEAGPVRIRLADAAVLERHWEASLFAKAFGDAQLSRLRERVVSALADPRRGVGVDAVAVARAARAIELGYFGSDQRGRPCWWLQADLGIQAPPVARGIAHWAGMTRLVEVPLADEAWSMDGLTVARFAGIVAIGRPSTLLPAAPGRAASDIEIDADLRTLAAGVRGTPVLEQVLALIATRDAGLTVRADLNADGAAWRGEARMATDGLRAVDRALLSALPADTQAVILIGVDGRKAWHSSGPGLRALADAALGDARGPLRDWLRGMLAGSALESLVTACDGTIALFATPGAPLPGMGLLAPRSQALDDAVAASCARFGCAVPAEGGSVLVPLQGLPVPVLLARWRTHWLLTSDARAEAWGRDGGAGFAASAMGAELLRRAPEGACYMAAIDGGAALRAGSALIGNWLDGQRGLRQGERQALLTGLINLSGILPPAYQWARSTAQGLSLAGGGGDPTWVALPALAVARALPGWLESRMADNEVAAMAALKSVIFPAEVQFQGACHLDQDADAIGEYGLLSELAGRRAAGPQQAGAAPLMPGPLATSDVLAGYRFTVFLPDGRGGAIGEPAGDGPRPSIVDGVVVKDADAQEGAFVAYAWPLQAESGTRMFAIDQSGQVRERIWDGQAPAWNSLYGGGTWADDPVWPVVQRGARRR